jgi:hypothetical protein
MKKESDDEPGIHHVYDEHAMRKAARISMCECTFSLSVLIGRAERRRKKSKTLTLVWSPHSIPHTVRSVIFHIYGVYSPISSI